MRFHLHTIAVCCMLALFVLGATAGRDRGTGSRRAKSPRGRHSQSRAGGGRSRHQSPNPRGRQASSAGTDLAQLFQLLFEGGTSASSSSTSFTWSLGDDVAFSWSMDDDEDEVVTSSETEVDGELAGRPWRGKGTFTGDIRIHCLDEGCSRGAVQVYNREEKVWSNICSAGWGKVESQVVCHYLRFRNGGRPRRLKAKKLPRTVRNSPSAWRNIACSGDENTINECAGEVVDDGETCTSLAGVSCLGRRDDEEDEDAVECGEEEVLCANGAVCVARSYVCDGMSDCPFGTDEENCADAESEDEVCHANQFYCGRHNGGCISNLFRCDADADCHDGLDEDGCDDHLQYFKKISSEKLRIPDSSYESGWRHVSPYVCAKKCREETSFNCVSFDYRRTTKECDLTSLARSDVSHELPTIITSVWDHYELKQPRCQLYECSDGQCISFDRICDNRADCPNREDERDCPVNPRPDAIYARLAGDSSAFSSFEGRLEVGLDASDDDFGLICDIGWSINEANVACRQLGFSAGAAMVLHGMFFQRTNLPYKLSDVRCRGDESSLAECAHSGWNNASCTLDHEAGVVCGYTTTTTTTSRPWTFSTRPTLPPAVTTTATTTTAPDLQCGVKPKTKSLLRPRIVGGTVADAHEWPWQAGIWFNGGFICGGTLIDQCWVLTAAHCLDEHYSWDWYKIVLGDHQTDEDESTEQQFKIKRVVLNNYNTDTNDNDIALVELQVCATTNEYVQTACLPTSTDQFPPGHTCHIVGWGTTEFEKSAPTQNVLREAEVPLISKRDCVSLSGYHASQLTENMLCAGFLRGGIDTCQGDSGGPLLCESKTNGRYYVWGVVSFGNGCAKPRYPGVYAKVANYLDWIADITA